MVERLRLSAILIVLSLLAASEAAAAPDFYGVKMKSEDFARDVFLIEQPKIPDFTNDRPGTDKRVYAYGYMSSFLGGGKGITIEVFNHSDGPIATNDFFRELTIVTYDGQRYERAETEMMLTRDVLKAGQRATFNFSFPGVRIHKDEVRMVICSFDMGQTTIFLFPLRTPEAPKKAVEKKEPEAPKQSKTVKKIIKKKVVKKKAAENKEDKKEEVPPAEKPHITPVKVVQGFFRGVGERLSGKKAPAPVAKEEAEEVVEEEVVEEVVVEADSKVPPDYPLVKPEQVIEGVRYQFRPDFRKEVQGAQKDVESAVYRDRPWSLDKPDGLFTHGESTGTAGKALPRREAAVLIVNRDYGFVVVDAGFENGFGKNVILDVIRDGRRVGKVMVTKPRDKIAGAVILPEWRTRDEIRVGDIVGVSS